MLRAFEDGPAERRGDGGALGGAVACWSPRIPEGRRQVLALLVFACLCGFGPLPRPWDL